MLQNKDVALTHVVAVRSHARLEPALAAWVASQPGFVPIAAGLGATDAPTIAHLLYNPGPLDAWWRALPQVVEGLGIGD